MSDYTITLKRISEVYGRNQVISWFEDYDLENYLSKNQIDELTLPDSDGITSWNKEKLAEMIFEHYFLREIAFETPEMFRHFAKVKLQEIMGKYLPLLWSASVRYNPFRDNETFHLTETFESTKNNEANSSKKNEASGTTQSEGSSDTTGKSNSTSTSNNSGLNVNSDTPQGQISKQSILEGNYATSTSASESSNTIKDETTSSSNNKLKNSETRINSEDSSEKSTGNQNENYKREKIGYDLKLSTMEKIQEYRKTIQNYNLQIIEDLNPLFFALY